MLPARGTGPPRVVHGHGCRRAVLGLLFLVRDAAPAPVHADAPFPARLAASGGRHLLRDGLGRVVFLRGVDAGGRSKFAPYVPFDYPSGQYAAGARRLHGPRGLVGHRRHARPVHVGGARAHAGAGRRRLAVALPAAARRGVGARHLDRRRLPPGRLLGELLRRRLPVLDHPRRRPRRTTTAPSWQLEYFDDSAVEHAFDVFWANGSPVQNEYLAAWDAMIARFQNEPGVVGFEPINEPAAGTQNEDDVRGDDADRPSSRGWCPTCARSPPRRSSSSTRPGSTASARRRR